MSAQHTRERIRIAFDVESHKPQTDNITAAAPEMWRNNDVQFELGFFFNGDPIDASQYQDIKLIVKEDENRQAAAPLMQGIVAAASIEPVFTIAEWENQAKQHCTITFTADETRLDLQGKNDRTFWLAVIARTNDGKRITLGSTKLKLHHDGEDETSNTPPIGSSLVPIGSVYSGAGVFVLNNLTPGKWYTYVLAANDTKLVNGAQELTESGNFIADGASVTLHGDASTTVTAGILHPVFLTLDEQDARFQRADTPWRLSPNKRWLRVIAVDDDGRRIDQVIDLQNL